MFKQKTQFLSNNIFCLIIRKIYIFNKQFFIYDIIRIFATWEKKQFEKRGHPLLTLSLITT